MTNSTANIVNSILRENSLGLGFLGGQIVSTKVFWPVLINFNGGEKRNSWVGNVEYYCKWFNRRGELRQDRLLEGILFFEEYDADVYTKRGSPDNCEEWQRNSNAY